MEFSFVIFRVRDHNRVRYWSPFGTTTWVLKKCEFQKPGKVMRREREGGGGREREKEDEGCVGVRICVREMRVRTLGES